MADIFTDSLSWGAIVTRGQEQGNHQKAINKAIQFLEKLKTEPPVPEKLTGILGKLQHEEKQQAQKQHRPQVAYNNYGGTMHTGYGNIEQNVKVKDVVFQISEEIGKLPDSEEKRSVLQALKAITSNETFASVSGAFIGTLLGKIVNPTVH